MSENDLHLPSIDYNLCTICGVCVTACPTGALELTKSGPSFSAPEKCTYCTDCEALCPSGAISCDFEISWEMD